MTSSVREVRRVCQQCLTRPFCLTDRYPFRSVMRFAYPSARRISAPHPPASSSQLRRTVLCCLTRPFCLSCTPVLSDPVRPFCLTNPPVLSDQEGTTD